MRPYSPVIEQEHNVVYSFFNLVCEMARKASSLNLYLEYLIPKYYIVDYVSAELTCLLLWLVCCRRCLLFQLCALTLGLVEAYPACVLSCVLRRTSTTQLSIYIKHDRTPGQLTKPHLIHCCAIIIVGNCGCLCLILL